MPESSSMGRHLAFLPIPFPIQMLSAEHQVPQNWGGGGNVLDIQSIFITVSILNSSSDADHSPTNPTINFPVPTSLWHAALSWLLAPVLALCCLSQGLALSGP